MLDARKLPICCGKHLLGYFGLRLLSPGPAADGVIIQNNIIKNGYYKDDLGPTGASGIQCYNCGNMLISHNAISNIQGMGTHITTWNAGATISGLTVTGNVIYSTCLGIVDCGGIYQQDANYASTGISITNNYVRDANPNTTLSGGSGIGSGIYLDDCTSNATVSGNIITGASGGATTTLHGGSNDTLKGNIIDLSGYARQITQYVASGICNGLGGASSPMTGNSYIGNIIIGAGGGGGYFGGTITGATNPAIGGSANGQANDYYNYGGSAISGLGIYGSSQLTVNDSNPQNLNPQLSGCYASAPGSPVFSPAINFPPIIGGWGPPGYTIPPASGPSVPSYPSPTC